MAEFSKVRFHSTAANADYSTEHLGALAKSNFQLHRLQNLVRAVDFQSSDKVLDFACGGGGVGKIVDAVLKSKCSQVYFADKEPNLLRFAHQLM
jgi:2-polyprenyl-3-methyl-5-hydroxy-6-metoxy-1,4-benzoquinol methylase